MQHTDEIDRWRFWIRPAFAIARHGWHVPLSRNKVWMSWWIVHNGCDPWPTFTPHQAEVDNGKVDDDNNDNEDDDMDVAADNEVHGGNNINDWGSSLDDDSRLISSSL